MKKITKLSILLAALAFASSCQDEAGLNPPQPLEVSLSASSADTRTALDGGAVKWEKGDEVALVFTHPTKAAVVETLSTSIQSSAVSADFKGKLPLEVTDSEGGYDEAGYAVYPTSAVAADGTVNFTLPAEQRVRANGTFASGLNLMSASVSLSDIQDDGKASATFRNAFSILRFNVASDVTSVTLTGSAPLAGKAPVSLDGNGRLVVESGSWSNSSNTVTLKPADGSECFNGGEVNLLVWPGTHSQMSVTVNTKEYGSLNKTSTQTFTFEPSKYYTLNFNVDSETLVEELVGKLDVLEPTLSDLESQLAALETNAEKVKVLVDQIQSVALLSEYLDNAVYVKYAQQMYSMMKLDFQLNYIVRPAAAMELLLDLCAQEGNLSDVLSGKLLDNNGQFGSARISDAVLEGDLLTVTVNAADLADGIYKGTSSAHLALQISDGNTDVLSDFVKLVPKAGAGLSISRTENVPVLKGASFSMPYQYGAYDYSQCQVTVEGTGFTSAPTITANSGSGNIRAYFNESDDLSRMSMKVTLKSGDETDTKIITFADGGSFKVATPSQVDYIGGEVALNVTENSFGSYQMQLNNGGGWIYETNTGVGGLYTVNLNSGSQRSADVQYTISNGTITYTKSVTITQKASGTALTGSYFKNNEKLMLSQKTASCANAVNLVILGDGYQKKDLQKGGKFERSARSAMDAFFATEPFTTFKDRFNVYMVANESQNEGPRLESVSESSHSTYFGTYYKGGGNTYVNASSNGKSLVSSIVQNTLGLSGNLYYRTIVILLVNTSENVGSTDYPSMTTTSESATGDGYASFSIAILAANSTETGGLIRHEAGGHAFGRLGDEYNVDWYTASLVNERHNVGFYKNIATSTSYWSQFTSNGYGSDKVSYFSYCAGDIYRSTNMSGIMWNNKGAFNAVSRHAIYERIIKQTEGSSAYSFNKFLQYDRNNN